MIRRRSADGDYAMEIDNTATIAALPQPEIFTGDSWVDALEAEIRGRIQGFIEAVVEEELESLLSRGRYERPSANAAETGASGHRHGHRKRTLRGTFGEVTVSLPRARLVNPDGTTSEWKNATIPAYKRRTRQVDALIASTYLSGTNTRRVRRALGTLFGRGVGKDVVSRTWRKIQADWQAWGRRSLQDEPVVRLILDGTVVRVRLDKKATSISLLVALGVRQDGQKILLGVRNMGGESEAAWRALLDDLVARGLATPELLITDGSAGLEKALAALWPEIPVQRCTVHKHRNLLAHAPDKLHEELSADYTDMIYAKSPQEVEQRRKAFLRKWRVKCRAVADSLEEAGDRLFTFTRFPICQWKSLRTTNAIERLHEEFKRRIKTQTVLPSAETAAMLFWALVASGQVILRKVDGWQTIAVPPNNNSIDLAA
jgi:putative transposase